jgi:hypothetical protein
MKGYKPNKKYIKFIQQEIVSVGFPESVFQTQFLNFQLQNETRYISNNHILIEIEDKIDQNEFQKWKNDIHKTAHPTNVAINNSVKNGQSISEQILQFDLSNATPIDCMNFINQLKSLITLQNQPP